MAYKFRIDSSGNLIVGGDTASTTPFYLTLYLVSLFTDMGLGVEYDNESYIKGVRYDSSSNRLSWTQDGQEGSYTMTTTSLQDLLATATNSASSELTEAVVKRIVGESADRVLAFLSVMHNGENGHYDTCGSNQRTIIQKIEALSTEIEAGEGGDGAWDNDKVTALFEILNGLKAKLNKTNNNIALGAVAAGAIAR